MTNRTVPRQESPAYILSAIMASIVGVLLCLLALPIAIIGILLFNIVDGIKDALKRNKAWCWFVGRRVQP